MADYQIGDNLYADAQGKYYSLNNGAKSFVSSPYDEMTKKLNTQYDTQRNTQLEQLRQQRDKAVQGFNQQKKDLAPQYQNQRNQADVVNHQNVARLRELMAANGINASGENLTTQASLASARQNAFSEINNNEQLAFREIDKQIADWNDPSREQAINNSIETERTKALSQLYNQAQQEIYQKYMDYRNYQMEKQRFDLEMKLKEAQLAASRSSGSSSRRSSSSSKSSNSNLSKAYNQYQQAKTSSSKTPVDKYYESMDNIFKGSVVRKQPVYTPPSIGTNANLSNLDRYRMIKQQYGLR